MPEGGPPMVHGDHLIDRDTTFVGMVEGTLTVTGAVTVTMAGMIVGDLIVREGATVRLTGMVVGEIVERGGRVET